MKLYLLASFGLFLLLPAPLQAQTLQHVPATSAATSSDLPFPGLPRLSRALRTARTARILAIGSSSTAGIGASSPSRTYVVRLETNLETALTGTDFDVVGHGLSGELAQGAADRMKREVEEIKPDLVIWQVGTNDALRHVALNDFTRCLGKTLAWLKQQQLDVVLINPQYGHALVKDPYYEQVVAAIATIAREQRVPLVDRFETMRKLQRERGGHFDLAGDDLHMNDEGYRHLAEHVAAIIIKSLPKDALAVAAAPVREARAIPERDLQKLGAKPSLQIRVKEPRR